MGALHLHVLKIENCQIIHLLRLELPRANPVFTGRGCRESG